MVEARRVELLSEIISSEASPGAVSVQSIPLFAKPADRPVRPVASYVHREGKAYFAAFTCLTCRRVRSAV